jgi:hypothetical protein
LIHRCPGTGSSWKPLFGQQLDYGVVGAAIRQTFEATHTVGGEERSQGTEIVRQHEFLFPISMMYDGWIKSPLILAAFSINRTFTPACAFA